MVWVNCRTVELAACKEQKMNGPSKYLTGPRVRVTFLVDARGRYFDGLASECKLFKILYCLIKGC